MKRKNCTKCKHFTSFMAYYEDELESEDVGFCDIRDDGENVVDDDDYCEEFEKDIIF